MPDIERYRGGIEYARSADVLSDAKAIIDSSQRAAHSAINAYLVLRNWLLGRRIVEEELGNGSREDLYGKGIIPNLSKELTQEYGKGFAKRKEVCTSMFSSTGCSQRLCSRQMHNLCPV